MLLLLEVFYFKIATFFNIVDQPNLRSSHQTPTLRGGGILFPFAVLIYLAVFGFAYGYFILGLLLIAIISFADDIKPKPKRIRAGIQLMALAILLYQVGFSYNLFLFFPLMIFLFGLLNAYNFMDGINGMTALYSFTVLGALYFLNEKLAVLDQRLIICVAIANLVFAFFNCRIKPVCFAGDVGSISMAFTLLFFTSACVFVTSNPIFLMFYALYIADVGATVIQRIFQRDNIFEPHRKHLFQYLVNEKGYSHIAISLSYMVLQSIINLGVLIYWQKVLMVQWVFAGIVFAILFLLYFLLKRSSLKQLRLVEKK